MPWTRFPYGGTDRLGHIEDGIEAVSNGGSQTLREWTMAESYEPSGTISRDSNEVPTSFSVLWPDGSAGLFTTTATDSLTGAINAFTITHTNSGLTVTQAAVTRDTAGAVTTKPALTVA